MIIKDWHLNILFDVQVEKPIKLKSYIWLMLPHYYLLHIFLKTGKTLFFF